eukprot:5425651-Amphidinium_carterae.1
MQNILIARTVDAESNVKYVPKIADIGLATRSDSRTHRVAGTCAYMAPETYDGRVSEKSDVYSFGHVMLRTFCPTRQPLRADSEADIKAWLSEEWRGIDEWVTLEHCNAGAQCICKCAHQSEDGRPTFAAIVHKLQRLHLSIESARPI